MFRTLFVYTAVVLYILIVGLPLLLLCAVTGNTDRIYRAGIAGARMAFWLAGVRVVVEGRQKIPTALAVVFMSNHQSNCDPPALVAILPPILILAKKEVFRIPILGDGMRMRGFIPVDRKSREQAFAAVDQAVESIKNGHSFLVFPEGTRSKNGRLQAFKKGVFVMAIKAGVPIMPISVSGGSKIIRKGEFAIHEGTLRITIHDPVPTAHYSIANRAEVAAQVRHAILAGLAPDERPLEPDSA
ncbi:MAG: 1-acyl-sn-glycerol-3-phosphate acyltransferase [Acidobacteria bacterium]|nr:1-acyl-sn-glycerol-3-phosphate acyltransferase [Acidobacteriota bacterium]